MKKAVFLAILLSIFVIMGCGDDDIVQVEEELFVFIVNDTATVFYNEPYQLTFHVYVTTDTTVKWYINGIENGNDTLGTIDSNSVYLNEQNSVTIDDIWLKAVSQVDTTKSDSINLTIRDRYLVYVDSASDDATGKGTIAHPYRTITQGLAKAIQGQIVRVAAGTYNDGETFPLIPRDEVGVKGADTSQTIVQPPSNQAAFRFRYENSYIENLTIRGLNKQGIGVQFGDPENPDYTDGIDTLKTQNIVIENVHTAAIKSGQSTNIKFTGVNVRNCVYGFVVDEPGDKAILTGTRFTDIDSIAINLIDPITSTLDLNSVSIDGANIGVFISEGSFGFLLGTTFANIDSIGVLNSGNADLEGVSGGDNDFSALTTWCFYNLSPNTISAQGNTWPSSDSTTIDTQYIYDDDENENLGVVVF